MKYTDILLKDQIIHVARVRHSRHLNVSIHQDGEAYATYPWYSSKKDLLAFLETRYEWIVKSKDKMLEKVSKTFNRDARYTDEELLTIIKNYIKKYENIMNADGYDIRVDRISLRHMTTRLGSCTPSNKSIRFSTELNKCSDRYIEYVVVHELAHLVECNHSKRFWDIVKRYINDYKKIEK